MNWYTACLVFEVENLDIQNQKWFEETWIMVPSGSEKEALVAIEFHGASQTEIFQNTHGEKISWEFKGYRHLQAMASDGEIVEIVSLSKSHPGYFQKTSREMAYIS